MTSQLTGGPRRVFWKLTIGQFLLFCGFTMFFQFPLFIKSLGGQEREIGLIMGLGTVGSTLFLPWAAARVNHLDRRRMMLIGTGLVCLTTLACWWLTAVGVWMGALIALRGLGFVSYLISNGAYLVSVLPPAERARWFSIYLAFWSLSAAFGPGLGETIIVQGGFDAFFPASAAVVGLSALVTLSVPRAEPLPGGTGANPLKAVAHFFVELMRPRFRYLFLSLLVMTGAIVAVLTFSATYLHGLGLSSGVFFATYAAVGMGTRVWGGGLSDRWGRRPVVLPTLVVLAAGMLLYSFTREPLLQMASACLIGLGFGLANPTISAEMLDRATPELQGIAVGSVQFAFNLGMLLSLPVLGVIAQQSGYPTMWQTTTGMVLLAALIYLLLGGRGAVARGAETET